MNKTIQMSIGIVITVIFFGTAFYYSANSLHGQTDPKIKDFSISRSGDTLIITFQTTEEMQGRIGYTVGADGGNIKLTDFETFHRAEFDGSGYVGQTFEAYVEACDALGKCEFSETITEVI